MNNHISNNIISNWVFAYGSLMWRPNFKYSEMIPAVINGWQRDMCIISIHYRGTSSKPGLVSGLKPGGRCQGRAYKVSDKDLNDVVKYLDARELITNVYTPEYKEIVLKDNRIVKARVYISNVSHKHYVGNISENEKVNFLTQGIGSEGRSIEYLKNIIEQLSKLEIVDQGLIHLLQLCNKP